jgi:hypothetical protein
MQKSKLLSVFLSAISTLAVSVASSAATLSPEKAQTLGCDLYFYAFPIALMNATMRQATNVPNSTAVPMRAPLDQFSHFRTYPKSDSRDVVRFNFDTLYSFAWLDLSNGPIVLSVPDTHGRYYLIPSLDMWTDVFSSLGSRRTGTEAGQFAFVPPGWSGQLPPGVTRINAPTSRVWIMGRAQTNGPADYDNVHRIQDGFRLTPVSEWGKVYNRVEEFPVDPTVDNKTPPLDQVEQLDGMAMLTLLAELMKTYPPHPNDYPIIFRMRALGLVPGQDFDPRKLDPQTVAAIDAGGKLALEDMVKRVQTIGSHVSGWSVLTENVGTYGTSYEQRAVVALAGLGANLPEDAIYPTAFVDAEGQQLNGAYQYRLHFEKGQLPPANAFWSITMYDERGFQVPNAINRFAIGDRDKLMFNADGSLDLYVQSSSPAGARAANGLPAPTQGPFALTMRIYSPRAVAFDGTWKPPPVNRVNNTGA